jgi:hypothetical protein
METRGQKRKIMKETFENQDVIDLIAPYCDREQLQALSKTTPLMYRHITTLLQRCLTTRNPTQILPNISTQNVIIRSFQDYVEKYKNKPFAIVSLLEYRSTRWKDENNRQLSVQEVLDLFHSVAEIQIYHSQGYVKLPVVTYSVSFRHCANVVIDSASLQGSNKFGLDFEDTKNITIDASILSQLNQISIIQCTNFVVVPKDNKNKHHSLNITIEDSHGNFFDLVRAALEYGNIGILSIKNNVTSNRISQTVPLHITNNILQLEFHKVPNFSDFIRFLILYTKDEIWVSESQITINTDGFKGKYYITGEESNVQFISLYDKTIEDLVILYNFPVINFGSCKKIKLLTAYYNWEYIQIPNVIDVDKIIFHMHQYNSTEFKVLERVYCKELEIHLHSDIQDVRLEIQNCEIGKITVFKTETQNFSSRGYDGPVEIVTV